ncbi:MAG TPA: OsmC family protein [Gemmatimonadaceae bacterium]|nr:OsmC family protein [Gemmatimonadaceae bacterium]
MSEAKRVSRVQVAWRGGQRFDGGRPGGPTLRLDGTGETGQSPVDALLSALASCVSIDVVEILAKRRTPAERVEIAVEGERASTTPKRITAIALTFEIDGAGIDREQAARAIDLSITRYCSVRDSLARDIPIVWNLVLNGESGVSGEVRASA